jgi:chemotaxis response regulator CheB
MTQQPRAQKARAMNDILSRRTPIPVRVATDGIVVEPDTIYLNPPKKQMIISGGRLLLADKDPNTAIAYPIDHFLRSLANDAPGASACARSPSVRRCRPSRSRASGKRPIASPPSARGSTPI